MRSRCVPVCSCLFIRDRVSMWLPVLLFLLPASCWAICVEDGELPTRTLDLNCTGSPHARYCCKSPKAAVNDTACVPHPWTSDACQGGYFASEGGYALPCPDGFYCPQNALCLVRCSLGAYCKLPVNITNSTGQCRAGANAAQCCHPYYEGTERRSDNSSVGFTCGGANADQPCAEGFYCPSPVERVHCPESHYCREGSREPQSCPTLSSCKARSSAPKVDAFSLVLCILLGLALLGFYIIFIKRKLIHGYIILYIEWLQREDAELPAAGAPTLTAIEDLGSPSSGETSSGNGADVLTDAEWQPIPSHDGPVSPQRQTSYRGRQRNARSTSQSLRGTKVGILMWVAGVRQQQINGEGEDSTDGIETAIRQCQNFIKPKTFTLHLEFTNISLAIKGKKNKVVTDASGSIAPGNLTAIMGGSGTGKTSLLNCLCGKAYYGEMTGKIKFNGQEGTVDKYRSVVGFVPQDDVMHTNLTVHEVLMYQAWLRLPRSWSQEEREKKVKDLEDLLGLTRVRSSIIGTQADAQKISGGQRKRVNIGMEMVADPTLLFLDEPTSGLDSVTSKEVIGLLKAIANTGKLTVVIVIHQPRVDIFKEFDDLILMEKEGRIAFQGSLVKAQRFFKELDYADCVTDGNPADYYLDCINSHNVRVEERLDEGCLKGLDTIADEWNKRRAAESWAPEKPTFLAVEFKPVIRPLAIVQFWYLLRRYLLLLIRTWWVFGSDLFMVVLAGLVLGALFNQITLERLIVANIMSGMAVGLTGMIAALRPFGSAETRPVFWRESAAGINRFAYFCSVMVGQIPAMVLFPIFFLSFYYSLTGPRASFGSFYVIFLFTYWATFGIGYMLSTIFRPDNSKMAAVVLALIASAVGGSATTTICKLRKYTFIGPLMYSIAYTKWYNEGLFEAEAKLFPPVLSYQVELLAGLSDYSLSNMSEVLWALFGIGAVCRIIAFLLLIFTNRGKQDKPDLLRRFRRMLRRKGPSEN